MNTILTEARRRSLETHDLARKHLNPALVDVLQILGFDVCYERACGSCLYTTEGVEVLDMHAGEGFATLGHNHPQVKAVLQEVLEQDLPGGVQIQFHVLSGMLAEALCRRMPGSLDAVYFCSSGAEAVDAAMKFARVSTGRPRFLSCHGGIMECTWVRFQSVGSRCSKSALAHFYRAVFRCRMVISPGWRRN